MDEKILYDCISDKKYKNPAEFEIILNNIKDKKLAIGFLCHLYVKRDIYGVDKETIISILSEFDIKFKPEELIQYNKYFINTLELFISHKKKRDEVIMSVLNTILKCYDFKDNLDNRTLTERFSEMSIEELEIAKEYLIENELYECIDSVDANLRIHNIEKIN